jgi:hypothetical protein
VGLLHRRCLLLLLLLAWVMEAIAWLAKALMWLLLHWQRVVGQSTPRCLGAPVMDLKLLHHRQQQQQQQQAMQGQRHQWLTLSSLKR